MMKVLMTGGSGFIGTNLAEALLKRNISFVNLDISSPKLTAHDASWRKCDILDFDYMYGIFLEFQPTHVIHLAARTDTASNDLDDYRVNFEGTANLLKCIKSISAIQRVIITSSQFVLSPPGIPLNDEDYRPIGAYGESKMIAENYTRSAELNCIWTITRPTNVWGPWHPRYPEEFWLILKKGLYFHPGGNSVVRSYGYVGNVVFQMMKILTAEDSLVDKRVYYLGDLPIPLIAWANGFSLAIRGAPVRVVPRFVLKLLSLAGTLLNGVGLRFPLSLSRYHSMTQDYFSPIDTTIAAFGNPPYSLEEGIDETVDWLELYWNGGLR